MCFKLSTDNLSFIHNQFNKRAIIINKQFLMTNIGVWKKECHAQEILSNIAENIEIKLRNIKTISEKYISVVKLYSF